MVAVDSGMNRIGVQAEEVPEFLEGIKNTPILPCTVFYTLCLR